ncbi:MAG TPA: hypothetical protein PKA63_11805 [Oligoflexia bacterium]|nr:hypothetical protein [Oligoflexia bacterium]HMP49338.1 hypothetical protein [Oligoflexia bacterium]
MKRCVYAITITAVSFLSILTISCGSSGTNNDQGTSLLAYGFFVLVNDQPVPSSFATVSLFSDLPVDGIEGRQLVRLIGVENRMTRQFVRLLRADCSYNIAGSFIRIPNDSITLSRVLGPAPDPNNPQPNPGGGGAGGDIDPGANVFLSNIALMSPDLFSFLNNNRNLLPELPFRMSITCAVTGVTQSGTTMKTNDVNYFIQFSDEPECCTGDPGFQQGPGTGGDLVTTPSQPTFARELLEDEEGENELLEELFLEEEEYLD